MRSRSRHRRMVQCEIPGAGGGQRDVQTERVVDKDNTVAIGSRSWQIEKTRFRHTLAKVWTLLSRQHLAPRLKLD